MLDVSPQNLYQEVRAAEALRDHHTSNLDSMLEEYHGPTFSDVGERKADFLPENHWHEYLSLVVPRVIFDNPRVRVTSKGGGVGDVFAEAMQHALNRWIRDTKLRRTLMRVAVDMFFGYGITVTNRRPRPQVEIEGKRVKVMWPQAQRIPPKHYFQDPLALSRDELRYQGHKWVQDKSDLIAQAKADPDTWNLNVIESMAENVGVDELDRTENSEGLSRNELVCRDIWIPEYELEESEWKRLGLKKAPTKDEGFNGAWATLAIEQMGSTEDADFVRPLRPYYGPPSGPYAMFGVYYVPGSCYPLSPLVAVRGLVDELNEMARGISGSIQRYKRFIAADSEVATKVKSVPHDNVVPIPGFDRVKAEQFEVGGVTEQMLAGQGIFRDRLERNSGLNDAMRGNVSGEGTATENMIADEAASARMGFINQQFSDSTQEMLEGPAWFFFYDDEAVVNLGPEGGSMNLRGGSHDQDEGLTMEDQELEIEPYSMSRTNEGKQQARSRLIMDVSANLLPVMAQFPDAVEWKKNLNDMGDAVNVPGLGDRFHPDKAAEALGRQMEAEAEIQARYSSASGGDQGGGGFAPKQPPGAKNRGAQPPKVGGGVEKAATAGAGR